MIRKSIFSGCPGSEISMRQRELPHLGQTTADTTHVASAATALFASPRMRNLPSPLVLSTYLYSTVCPSWLPTMKETVIGSLICAFGGRADAWLKDRAV